MKTRYQRPIIGIMGPGNPSKPEVLDHAETLGEKIARNNWILLTGGRNAGVMNAASRGACNAGGAVLGILPGASLDGMSPYVTIPVPTGMGSARNVINILASNVVIVCGMGAGTSSEAALALKHGTPVIFTRIDDHQETFFTNLTGKPVRSSDDPSEVIRRAGELLESSFQV